MYYFTRGWPWESGSGTISLISGGDFCIDFTLHPSFLALPFTRLSASLLICSHHAWLPHSHSASCTLALLCHCSVYTTALLQTTPQVPTALHAQWLSFKPDPRYPLLCVHNGSPSNQTPGTHCSACTTALLKKQPDSTHSAACTTALLQITPKVPSDLCTLPLLNTPTFCAPCVSFTPLLL